MKLAVCEAPADMPPGGEAWRALAARSRALAPDLLLLNELPFGPWISTGARRIDRVFAESQRAHDEGINRLGDLGARAVFGTRATSELGRSVNEAFIWEAASGARAVHTKQYFPDEPGYREARWFERGETHFRLDEALGVRVGFLICTEVMFNEWARRYGRMGAHLILVPRAAEKATLRNWKTAIRMAAIVSGCYVASSNRNGRDAEGLAFGGAGWIFAPNGDELVETSEASPVAIAEIDPTLAEKAKEGYPRYVPELPT
jgi:N-carbamoylputrescine amidase